MGGATRSSAPPPEPVRDGPCGVADARGTTVCTRGSGHGGAVHEHVTYTTVAGRSIIVTSDFFPR